MTHPGKEALERLYSNYKILQQDRADIRAYVEALKVKAEAWDDHMEAEGAVLRDALEHPERHRIIGPSEIRNEALEEAAKVADGRRGAVCAALVEICELYEACDVKPSVDELADYLWRIPNATATAIRALKEDRDDGRK